MKSICSFILLSLLILSLVLPVGGAEATISSVAADTSGPPPQEASVYISQAKAATGEQNWTSAILVTTRGLAWYPDNADLLCLQGYSFRKTGQFQKSVEVVSRAIPLDPSAVRYANRGYGYLALKNYSAALADAETGISHDAKYLPNYGVKALALQGMGRNTEALAAIETAISQSPETAHYWHVKGRVLAAGGDCTGAAAALETSLARDPAYSLPYPGFGSAAENRASLNMTCGPAPVSPTSTKSPLGWAAVIGCTGAVIAIGMRR